MCIVGVSNKCAAANATNDTPVVGDVLNWINLFLQWHSLAQFLTKIRWFSCKSCILRVTRSGVGGNAQAQVFAFLSDLFVMCDG